MAARQTKFYLNKRDKKVSGVCAGIADFTGFDVTLIRIAFALGILAAGGTLIPAYFIIAWIANDKPHELDYRSREDQKFWQGVRAKPTNSVRQVRSRFREIDRRLADMELHYTSQNSKLANEIESLR